jgi:2-methylcitrate dehydratase
MSSRRLAEWTSAVTFQDLPPAVAERAKQVVADFLAESLFVGATKPWGRMIAAFAAENGGGQPEATILATGAKTLASRAALANGTMALGFEFADVLWNGHARPYPFSVPPALALAEARHRSGKDLLVAVAAAYEVMYRMAAGLTRTQVRSLITQGFYPASLTGTFGAVAAAGKIIGLGPHQMNSALGVASAWPVGTFQGHFSGTWTRSLHGGIASERGVTSALLAERNFVATQEAIESVYKIFANATYDESALAGLGESWAIMDTWVKPYPMNATLHSAVEALLKIMRAHELHAADISAITVWWHMYVGFLGKSEVRSPVSAQASLPFVLAAAAARGRITVDEFTEEAIADPAILDMLPRITVQVDSELYERVKEEGIPARVTVRTTRGEVFTEEVLFSRGHPRNPMDATEMKSKFMTVTARVLPPGQCEELHTQVMHLDQIDDVATLSVLYSPGGRRAS